MISLRISYQYQRQLVITDQTATLFLSLSGKKSKIIERKTAANGNVMLYWFGSATSIVKSADLLQDGSKVQRGRIVPFYFMD